MNQKTIPEEILLKLGSNINIEELLNRRKLRFPIYIESPIMNDDISELELSVRSQNCLRRVGYHTVGDLVKNIEKSDDLLKIRNCGENSAREIMKHLFLHQYSVLSVEKQKKWLEELVKLNMR